MSRWLLLAILVVAMIPQNAWSQKKNREQQVRDDRTKVEKAGFWLYNDLPKAFEQAAVEKKPIVVVLRCLPCEECVKLDDDLVDTHPTIRPLLEKFVRVRVVGTNGLDLSLFQYDTDQSFAVFFLHADKTVLGRFGTRSHRTEWFGDVSLEGLQQAMEGALELHANFPVNQAALAGKRGPDPLFPTPEKFPSLAEKYNSTLNYEGNVVQSCIHCHQIGDAQRDYYRAQGKPLPEQLLYPYPHPKSLGLILDPHTSATVEKVEADSLAHSAGFKVGDKITSLNGQPVISLTDVQWVLHHTPAEGGEIQIQLQRGNATKQLTWNLPPAWRRTSDITWRSSSWGMRRMTTGGMFLEPLASEERAKLNIPEGKMALFAKHVGEYGAHATAKKAGFRKGDIVIEYAEKNDLVREADLFRVGMNEHKAEQLVPVSILREGKQIDLKLPMQK